MADTGGISAGEAGGVFAGAVAALTALGGGVRWFLHWVSGREETRATRNAQWEADLASRERAIEDRLSASLAKCEEHCAAVEAKFDRMRTALLLVIPELQRAAPYSPALRQARTLLGDSLPIGIGLTESEAEHSPSQK